MKRIKLGIIGCGRIASHHANMLRDIEEIELVSVCDLNEERAISLANENEVPYYKSYHQMLRSEEIDVVDIVTPSGMHPYHAIDIIERYQKNVIIEKPIVLNIDDAKKLESAAKKYNVKVFPIYQNRYNKAVQRVKKAIQNQELGRVVMGSVRLHWCRPQAYYERDPWRGTWAMDGGALTNQGIHYIDLLQWLVGGVDQVFSFKGTQLVDVEVEDTLTGCLKFGNQALGTVEITTAARPKDYEASITIMGEKGSAIISGIATNALVEFTPNPEECESATEEFPTVYGFGHRYLLQSVARDLLGVEEYAIPFEESLKAIHLLNALYTSAENEQPILVAENPVSSLLGKPDPELMELYTEIC